MPVQSVANETIQEEAANSAVPPVSELTPDLAAAKSLDIDNSSKVKRMALVAAGLALVSVALMYTYTRSGVESASGANGADSAPVQITAETSQPPVQSPAQSPAQSLAQAPLQSPLPRPAPRLVPGPEVAFAEPVLVDAIEPTSAVVDVSPNLLSKTPRPRPVISLAPQTPATQTSISNVLDAVIAPPPPTLAQPSSETVLDRITYGTVAALRATDGPLPTAAETAVLGFARSLQRDNRSSSDIAAMLQRAHDANSLRVPVKFLFADGSVDVSSILAAIEAQR